MSRRKRLTGKAEEMRQIAQVLRQNKLPETAIRAALLGFCGVGILMVDNGSSYAWSRTMQEFLGEEN